MATFQVRAIAKDSGRVITGAICAATIDEARAFVRAHYSPIASRAFVREMPSVRKLPVVTPNMPETLSFRSVLS
jgi:hypothetical protein